MICDDVETPKRQTVGSCGYDFYAPCDIHLEPGTWTHMDTEVRFDGTECKYKFFMMLVPRSSLGMKYGFRFSNTVGIIDQDYRDPICVEMTVDEPLVIKKGERYMQGIVLPYLTFTHEYPPMKERSGGMGSTNL